MLALDYITDLRAPQCEDFSLINNLIIVEVTEHTLLFLTLNHRQNQS